jgi:hypothetical protein
VAALVAFLSHTSTFATLAAMMIAAGVLVIVFGKPAARRQGGLLLATTALTVTLAIALYYGHFTDTYASELNRISGEVTGAPGARAPTSDRLYQPGGKSIPSRAAAVPRDAARSYSWPFLVLALAGIGIAARRFRRDPTWLVIVGWLLACLCLLVVGVLTPVDLRHYYAALPAMAVLAAVAAVAGWQRRGAWRAAAAGLCAWATVVAVDHWLDTLNAGFLPGE